LFGEHRVVSLKQARKAAENAGFNTLDTQVVARGKLQWSGEPGESDLLLTDDRAEMTVRLTASDTESVYDELVEAFEQDVLNEPVQVRGSVLESASDRESAQNVGAQFTLGVTEFAPGKTAKLPPLVPKRTNQPEKDESSADGWF